LFLENGRVITKKIKFKEKRHLKKEGGVFKEKQERRECRKRNDMKTWT